MSGTPSFTPRFLRITPLVLEARQRVTGHFARRHVDLEVELADLGCPGRIRDGREHVGVPHGRRTLAVDEVQLDLLSDKGRVSLE